RDTLGTPGPPGPFPRRPPASQVRDLPHAGREARTPTAVRPADLRRCAEDRDCFPSSTGRLQPPVARALYRVRSPSVTDGLHEATSKTPVVPGFRWCGMVW